MKVFPYLLVNLSGLLAKILALSVTGAFSGCGTKAFSGCARAFSGCGTKAFSGCARTFLGTTSSFSTPTGGSVACT
jgi:hypothetical protein